LTHLEVTARLDCSEEQLEHIANHNGWEHLVLMWKPGLRVKKDWFMKLGRSSGLSLKVFKLGLDERLAMPQPDKDKESEESREAGIEQMSMLNNTLLVKFIELCGSQLHTLGLGWFSYITNAGTSPLRFTFSWCLGVFFCFGGSNLQSNCFN
jgi:hypothetical protein